MRKAESVGALALSGDDLVCPLWISLGTRSFFVLMLAIVSLEGEAEEEEEEGGMR